MADGDWMWPHCEAGSVLQRWSGRCNFSGRGGGGGSVLSSVVLTSDCSEGRSPPSVRFDTGLPRRGKREVSFDGGC